MKKVMDIPFDLEGTFVSRENRFLGKVEISGDVHPVHVRDPGRLEEILYEGNRVLLKEVDDESRKTDYDLIAGKVDDNWILVNSGFHREIAESVLEDEEIAPFENIRSYKAEQMLGDSRMDFFVKTEWRKIWLEVKGCTLAEEGKALFPDAPTKRGKRHVDELYDVLKEGGDAALLILVFRPDAECFASNEKTDPDFAESFRKAVRNGLEVYPLVFCFDNGTLFYKKRIPLCE